MTQTKYLKGECSHCSCHLEFPADAIGMTTDCPHCGKTTELLLHAPPQEPTVPRRTIVWTVIAALILVAGLAGAVVALKEMEKWAARKKPPATGTKPGPSNTVSQKMPPPEPMAASEDSGFSASTINLEKTQGSSLVYAVGTISNSAARQRFGVNLELELLDSSGQKVGTARDYQAVIEPNGTWQFRALVVGAKAMAAKIASIKEQQ